jgi:hypothetical protein
MKYVVTPALILTFSPGEKKKAAHVSILSVDHPANPVAGFKGAGNVKVLSFRLRFASTLP